MKQNIAISNKIFEQEYQSKEMKDQATQTELTNQDLEQQQETIQALREQINQLKINKKT